MPIICPNCRTTLKDGTQMCARCGAIIDRSVSATSIKKETLDLSSARKKDVEDAIAEHIEKIDVPKLIDIGVLLHIDDVSKEFSQKVEIIIRNAEKQFGSFKNDFEAYLKLGNAFLSMKKYEKAIEFYDKAINLNPKSKEALNNKGTALYYLGRYNLALKHFDEVINIDPYSKNARQNKAMALAGMGKLGEGMNYYEQAKK